MQHYDQNNKNADPGYPHVFMQNKNDGDFNYVNNNFFLIFSI